MNEILHSLTTTWWGIAALGLAALCLIVLLSVLFYRQFFKRFYDVVLSGMAIIALSPRLLILIVLGAIKMKGNPFFTQLRPGKNEKIFKLVKFRTMTCEKDDNGELLPDEVRLTRYGRILRSTSLDELPELFNIFAGQMSIVGPRPLLVSYLPLYNEEQKHRHDVRPGLTGLAQVSGRNATSWEDRFAYDVEYTKNISLVGDVRIIFRTVACVLRREGISGEGSATMEPFKGSVAVEEFDVKELK